MRLVKSMVKVKPTGGTIPMFEKWGKGIEPVDYITKDEVQEMIDTAIRRHNRNAGMISMFVGFFVLGLFSEGLLRLIGVIPPLLPWLQINL